MVCREQLGYYSQELGAYIGLDISGIWGVEPGYVSFSVSFGAVYLHVWVIL